MRINNNIMALNAHRQLGINQSGASKSMEKLSSGFRINRAGDDAAGLAISEKMRGQIRGMKQASRNAQDGISLIQTAEGALNETHSILQRMRELAVQSSTDTNTDADRLEIQKEINQLSQEITRISTDTEFNTQKLLDGNYKGKFFHIGANEQQNVTLGINDMSAAELQVGTLAVQGTDTLEAADPAALAGGVDGVTGVTGEASSLTHDGVTITAAATGVAGNSIQVTFVDGVGTDVATEVTGDATNGFTVTLGTDDTGAVNADVDAVVAAFGTLGDTDIVVTGSGAETVSAAVEANLTGGVDEVVAVEEQAATVELGGITFTADTAGVAGNTSSVAFVAPTEADQALSVVDNAGVLTVNLATDAEGNVTSTIDEVVAAFNAAGLGVTAGFEAVEAEGIDVSTQTAADAAITVIDEAIVAVSAERSMLGAMQNRLEHTISNLGTSAENMQAAESRIRDLDMAEEIMAFTKNNILQQAATAMLAQANMAPQSVLQLLG